MIERLRTIIHSTFACVLGFHDICDGSLLCRCAHHERVLTEEVELFLEVQ